MFKQSRIYHNIQERRYTNLIDDQQYTYPLAKIDGQSISFESEAKKHDAYTKGFFFLEIPENLDIQILDSFNQQIFHSLKYRSMKGEDLGDPLLGFHERVHQIEQFLMEKRLWKKIYPQSIVDQLHLLEEIPKKIIKDVFNFLNIPESFHHKLSGESINGKGAYHMTFNHYRSEENKQFGLGPHKDDGFVTILRTQTAGLEVNRKQKWEKIKPHPNKFIVNFGLNMEYISMHSEKKIEAILHRVNKQKDSRYSFGFFTSSRCFDNDAGVYTYHKDKGLIQLGKSKDLINQNDEEIYDI